MKHLILVLSLFLCSCCCTMPDESRNVLEHMGMTNIVLGGYSWHKCFTETPFRTEFTANFKNERIEGYVCWNGENQDPNVIRTDKEKE